MKPNKDLSELADEITSCSKNASKYLQEQNFELAKRDFEEAFEISKQIRDPFTQRKCAFNLGAVYIRLGKATKGIEYLELAISPSSNHKDGNADLYFNMGLGYEMLHEFMTAVDYFKKALKEYKESDANTNDVMIIETLEKLARNSRYLKLHLEAADWYEELGALYQTRGNEEKRLVSIGEQIVQLRKANERDKCLNLVLPITNQLEQIVITPLTANMLNDVGLVLSQYEMFDKAENCYKRALTMVYALPTCAKLEAILLQNLGALANLTNSYSKSIEYHSKAAVKFEQLKNPVNEGHCFANLGYAYNQVGDVDKAMENFFLALRKAKDTGDAHSEWQVLESLGALSCNLGNLDLAIKYYTDAFKSITKDTGITTSSSEDRIQSKLFHLMKKQAEKQQQINNQQQQLALKQQEQQQQQQFKIQQQEIITKQQQIITKQSPQNNQLQVLKTQSFVLENNQLRSVDIKPNNDTITNKLNQSVPVALRPTDSAPVQQTRQQLIALRRLRVRRSGSKREFDKIARGVYVSGIEDVLDTKEIDKISTHSSQTYSGTDVDSTDSSVSSSSLRSSQDRRKKNNFIQSVIGKAEQKYKDWKMEHSEKEKRKNVNVGKRSSDKLRESILLIDEDKEQVQLAMQQILKKSGNKENEEDSSSESESDSESGSESLSETDEDSSDTEHHQKKNGPPTLPTQSPPQTLKDYETPVPLYAEIELGTGSKVDQGRNNEKPKEPHYAEIEFDTGPKINELEKNKTTEESPYAEINFGTRSAVVSAEPGERKKSMDFGPNYFADEYIIQDAFHSNKVLKSTSLSDTVFETIETPSETLKRSEVQQASTSSIPASDHTQMSRAERERFLFEQYQKQQQTEVHLPEKKESEKTSKICAVM
ncbi:uncharacterized protein DDB_G0290301 isoform X2 [Patella vulgata]|uniref:uncharacterized protein DDB_G0290301 isoform X2 n=1 Tax=Patella vulgata TaxID=6465 RepID=UPI0024A7DD12|nr:uncharacterized protein DDB_G0290301 isoform X2 [Patella vulgata]